MDLTADERRRCLQVFESPSDAYLQFLQPDEFAKFVYYLFERDRLFVPVYIDGAGDGGVDIELRSVNGAEPHVQGIVQCKRFTTRNVAANDMSSFVEAAKRTQATRRYFFTSRGFARPAIRIARESDVMLFDPAGIRFWVQDIKRREAIAARPGHELELPHPDTFPCPVICVTNNKGGVGKTTITGNLASALALDGGGVLVIDADPQRNLSKWLTDKNDFDRDSSLYAVVTQNHPIHPLIRKTLEPGIWLLPGCRELDDLPSGYDRYSLERRLAQALAALPLADRRIRYVIIDTPPALRVLTRCAIVASSHLLVPLQLDLFSKEGVNELLSFVSQVEQAHGKRPLRILGGVATMVDMRFKLGLGLLRKMPKIALDHERIKSEGLTEQQFWCGRLRQRVDYTKALDEHKTVISNAPGADAAKDVTLLAKEISRRVSNATVRPPSR